MVPLGLAQSLHTATSLNMALSITNRLMNARYPLELTI